MWLSSCISLDLLLHETVQQDCSKQGLSGAGKTSDLCQRQSYGTSRYDATIQPIIDLFLSKSQ